jgi:colicin import membrane protein
MDSRAAKIDSGLGVSFAASAVIHMAVFLLLVVTGSLSPSKVIIQETYYVDVVNLPTADPQSGSSGQKADESAAVASPPPAALPPPMKLPLLSKAAPKAVNVPGKAAVKAAKTGPLQEAAESESSFNERMAKLESNIDARREEAVLEKLRSKAKKAAGTKVGTPGASGTEAGSRYADYVKARLEDALRVTSSYTTKNPEVAVRLTISAEGRLSRMKIERSSGDATFELAVRRAIDLASEKFTAPPDRTTFENGFVFKPKGISNAISR